MKKKEKSDPVAQIKNLTSYFIKQGIYPEKAANLAVMAILGYSASDDDEEKEPVIGFAIGSDDEDD